MCPCINYGTGYWKESLPIHWEGSLLHVTFLWDEFCLCASALSSLIRNIMWDFGHHQTAASSNGSSRLTHDRIVFTCIRFHYVASVEIKWKSSDSVHCSHADSYTVHIYCTFVHAHTQTTHTCTALRLPACHIWFTFSAWIISWHAARGILCLISASSHKQFAGVILNMRLLSKCQWISI